MMSEDGSLLNTLVILNRIAPDVKEDLLRQESELKKNMIYK